MPVAVPIRDDPYADFLIVPPEHWDAAKCAQMARHVARDGVGTPYPFRGAVPELPLTTRYNGGCVENDTWYQGRHYSRPILATGYRWVLVPSWCWRIVAEPAR